METNLHASALRPSENNVSSARTWDHASLPEQGILRDHRSTFYGNRPQRRTGRPNAIDAIRAILLRSPIVGPARMLELAVISYYDPHHGGSLSPDDHLLRSFLDCTQEELYGWKSELVNSGHWTITPSAVPYCSDYVIDHAVLDKWIGETMTGNSALRMGVNHAKYQIRYNRIPAREDARLLGVALTGGYAKIPDVWIPRRDKGSTALAVRLCEWLGWDLDRLVVAAQALDASGLMTVTPQWSQSSGRLVQLEAVHTDAWFDADESAFSAFADVVVPARQTVSVGAAETQWWLNRFLPARGIAQPEDTTEALRPAAGSGVIYGLITPAGGAEFVAGAREGRVFYVGQSTQAPARRLQQHQRTPSNAVITDAIAAWQGQGLLPTIFVLDTVPDTQLDNAELWWIDEAQARGGFLLNYRDRRDELLASIARRQAGEAVIPDAA